MNGIAPLRLASLLTMALSGPWSSLPALSDAIRLDGTEADTAIEIGPADDGDADPLHLDALFDQRRSLLSLSHLPHRLSLGAGAQVQGTGNPDRFLVRERHGRSLADRPAYALVGFAGYRSNHGWAVGPEAWVNADPHYRIRGLGVAVRNLRAGPLRVDLRLGATRELNLGRAINGGVEFRWYKP
ncbi:MAG: hypothetical protein Q8M37_06755 [Nevskia sp.]|nr:hypothetical protein [Nevskia sp.]